MLQALIDQGPARVIVVCSVMQEEAQVLAQEFPFVRFVAMRISKNRYKGVGRTDTGHRLFNTTYLD